MKFSFFILFSLLSINCHALDDDFNQPIHLSGDYAKYSTAKMDSLSYQGNVVLIQGSIKIQADQLTVLSNREQGGLQSIVLTGEPVKFQQQQQQSQKMAYGQANKVLYDATKLQIRLIGQASLSHDGSNFSADNIRYGLKDGDMEGLSSTTRRVQLIIAPNAMRKVEPIRPQ
ncbi:lipopolysaccharide export system protein LptA [Acinetobacter calcoaceticus]|uniref:Lipopolysaccharide export system protein LptA n=1 Tax=Acinetobacter calcoaceticus TaxID=471 RepID=A0A4R1XIR1_ACICA|nr:lipopolysaccharide export system protein LptA [Acinetobacter calcoaceticus]